MKVYLVRHGETDENATGIVQGWLDTSLNEKGLKQARFIADKFNEDIEAIYSSDLKRASRTAHEFVLKYRNIPYTEDSRLRERNFGEASGTHRDSHDWEQFWSLNDSVSIEGAETLDEFTKRVSNFLDELKQKPYDSVLVVAHGGVLNRMQAILDPDHSHVPHKNASIIQIKV